MDPQPHGLGGTAAYFVAVGAQVAIHHDESSALAQLSDGSSVTKAGSISVLGNSTFGTSTNVTAEGANIAGLSGGAAVAGFEYTGGASLLGGTGVETHATSTSTVQAGSSATSLTATAGDIVIEADASTAGGATAKGVDLDGLIAVGISKAVGVIAPTVTAYIDAGTADATGNVEVLVEFGEDPSTISVWANGSEGALSLDVSRTATADLTLDPRLKSFVGDTGGAGTSNNKTVTAGKDIVVNAFADEESSVSAQNTGNGFFNADGDANATLTQKRQVNAYGNTGATVIVLGGVGVDIGSGAKITSSTIDILSRAVIANSDIISSFEAQGFYTQPEPTSRFSLGYNANNNQAEGGPGISIAGNLTAR